MNLKRRNFIGYSAGAAGLLSTIGACINVEKKEPEKGKNILKPLTDGIVPITLTERKERIEKAQKLLIEYKIDALLLDAGTSMKYFTGVNWWPSERTLAVIIPASGELTYVCPAFEADRLKEKITIGKNIITWEEDQNPFQLIANRLKENGLPNSSVGVEENMRFFISNGIQKELPKVQFVSGNSVTIPCRIIKSEAEILLMKKANEITLEAIRLAVSHLKEGMTQGDLSNLIMETQGQLGGSPEFALCLFGKDSAFPHGTIHPQKLKAGDVVLMDCGCSLEGYNSDITRTIVFGKSPTKRQEEIWLLEKKAQEAGFASAKLGATGADVDAAARKVIEAAGFGPDYKLPGLPHRTGHGIGMDGHEWGNMVRGNNTKLEPGMCFSIEPTIAIPGEFGIRLEDCVYMTKSGPEWFSKPSKSLQEPFE